MKLKTRISPIIAMFMLGTALIYDGTKAFIELITFGFLGWLINPFINFWATMTFWFWFTFLGVKFMKSGKMLGAKIVGISAPSFIGLLPWVGSLPYWTSGVYVNLMAVYVEDLLEALTPQTLSTMASIARKAKTGAKSVSSKQKPGGRTARDQKPEEQKEKKKVGEDTKQEDQGQSPEKKEGQATEQKKQETESQKKEQEKKETKEAEGPEGEQLRPEETEPTRDYTKQQEDKKQPPIERENFANYLDELAKRKRREQGYPEYNEDLGEIIYPDEDDEDWPIAV